MGNNSEQHKYPISIRLSLQHAKIRLTQTEYNEMIENLRKWNIDFSATINASEEPFYEYSEGVTHIYQNLKTIEK